MLIARLAAQQHGAVARWQLLRLGASRSAIAWRIRNSRLHVLRSGIYSVGPPSRSQQQLLVAALLSLPRGSVGSHRSAAGLQRLHTWDGLPEATAPRQRQRQGLILHSATLPRDEIMLLDGIPVTRPSRTLLDLAAVLDEQGLRRALNEAAYLRLALSPSLPELLERHPRRRGAATLRRILAEGRIGLERMESDLEADFRDWLATLDLPPAIHQLPIELDGERFRLDIAWPELKIAIELDHPDGHDHPGAIERDKRRDRRLAAAGWLVIRITARAFALERKQIEADLRSALTRAHPAPARAA